MIEMYSGLEKIEHMKNMLIGNLNVDALSSFQSHCNNFSECYGGCHHCIDAQEHPIPEFDLIPTLEIIKEKIK